jgi:ArsR family transcriptional regulator
MMKRFYRFIMPKSPFSVHHFRGDQRKKMNTTISLAQEVTRLHAEICSALADPSRILLLYALAEKPYTVNELANDLGLSQPTTSRHLKILREHHLVNTVRQGANVEYSLSDRRLIDALDLLRTILRDNLTRQASLVMES